MSDVIFPDGLMVKAPREGAPDFVKGSISIKIQELINWLGQQSGDWINLDMKVSKGGKWYAQVNTWKAENKQGGEVKLASDFVTPSASSPFDMPDLPF